MLGKWEIPKKKKKKTQQTTKRSNDLSQANENEPQSFQTSSPTCHQVPAERKQVLEMQNDVLED